MSNQYDISQQANYLDRKMFLDPAGPVTLQRFDVAKYPKLLKYEKIARGYNWTPEEIDLSKDKLDMKDASEAARHMFTSNLLRQTTLDSLQGKTPSQVFGPCCSLPELEALMSNWSYFETNIHSNSYSHIIRNIYANPSEIFENVHNIEPIVNMAASVGRYYSHLDNMNCQVALGFKQDLMEHKKAIWLAMHASYALEAIRFIVSFATSLAMMENRLFVGNGNIINLILQDELLHTEWTAYLLKTMIKDDADFAKIKSETEAEVYAIYEEVIAEEKQWAEYLCSKGVVIGLNAKILSSFVDWTANEKLKDIGIKYVCETIPKTHPIPWFLKHVHIETKQTALQESESTSYVIAAMSDSINLDELPDL